MKKLNQWMLIGISALGLAACGVDLEKLNPENIDSDEWSSYYQELNLTSDEEVDEEAGEADEFGGLSEEAKAVHQQVRAVMKGIHDQKREICSGDDELHQAVRTELDAIFNDDSLSRKEKHEAARAVIARYKDVLIADKENMKACIEENKEELEPLHEEQKEIAQACLIPLRGKKGPEDKGSEDKGPGEEGSDKEGEAGVEGKKPFGIKKAKGPRGKGKKMKFKKFPQELLPQLEAALLSDACAEVLDAPPVEEE